MVLAYFDDLLIAGTSRKHHCFWSNFDKSFSLKHSTVLTTQQQLRFLGKRICRHPNGDIAISLERSYYYSMLKHMDLDDNINPASTPSLRRPPVQPATPLDPDRHHIYRKVIGMLIWASLVRPDGPDLQFTAKDHTRHLAAPSEWDRLHLKHTLRYIKGTLHYKFLISPRLFQGYSVPLRQLILLHINTYCDSDWATDIESRKSTSGTVTSVLGVPLAFNTESTAEHSLQSQHHQQRRSSTPSGSASATAYISTSYFKNFTTSSTTNHRLEHFGNIETQYNLNNAFTTSPSLKNNKITDSHLHRQYISSHP